MNANGFHFAYSLFEIGLCAARALTVGFCLIALPTATAATFTVSNTGDSGPGSLRDAIAQAQQSPGSTVTFDPHVRGTIVLTGGAISISQSLTIVGLGAHRLGISGNDTDRIFDIEGSFSTSGSTISVSISGLKIKQRFATSNSLHGSVGGAIYVTNGAVLNLSGVVFSHNRAIDSIGGTAEGGAVALVLQGSLLGSDIVVQRNRAHSSAGGAALGGGFFNDATSSLTLADSLVTLNEALGTPGIGGGVFSLGTFTFDALTSVTGNTASTSGNDIGP